MSVHMSKSERSSDAFDTLSHSQLKGKVQLMTFRLEDRFHN